jgi:hypothetical protein
LIKCTICESYFIKRVHNAVYCSDECRTITKRQKTTEWVSRNKDHLKEYNSKYYLSNKNHKISKDREYRRRRMQIDIGYKLRQSLRKRLNKAILINQKSGSAIRDLGCTIEELKAYLESKFQEGMTWDNWGRGSKCWHIDHIKPLAAFDLTDRNQFKEANHYSNLQPLWEKDNLEKSDRLE